MNFCPNCGTRLNTGAKFCTECGTAVPTLPTAPAELANTTGSKKLADHPLGNDDVAPLSQPELTAAATPTADEPMPQPTVSLRSNATAKANPKLPLLILGIVALIVVAIFFMWSSFAGPKEEIWQTSHTDDPRFAVTAVRTKDDFKATIKTSGDIYSDPFAQNFVMHLEGQLAKTAYDQTEHIQPQFISLEFNTAIIEDTFSDYFNGGNFQSNDNTAPDNFANQLMMQTLDQKKDTLTSTLTVGFQELKSELSRYGSAQQLSAFDDFEKTVIGFVGGLYEYENGLGVRISLEQIQNLASAFGQMEPDEAADLTMGLMLLENNLMFEQIDATTARFDIPFAGESILFYKQTNN